MPLELQNLEVSDLRGNLLNSNIFSSLKELPSVNSPDLSNNNLKGSIPREGAIPEPKGQFSTFDESSFEGNPFLCGQQICVNCNSAQLEHPFHPTSGNEEEEEEEEGFMDMEDTRALLVTTIPSSSEPMLLGLFEKIVGYVSDPPKVVCFWRIRHGYGNIFGESKRLSSEPLPTERALGFDGRFLFLHNSCDVPFSKQRLRIWFWLRVTILMIVWKMYHLKMVYGGKAQLLKMVYAEYVYQRNFRVFEKKKRSTQMLAREIMFHVCVRAPEKAKLILQHRDT